MRQKRRDPFLHWAEGAVYRAYGFRHPPRWYERLWWLLTAWVPRPLRRRRWGRSEAELLMPTLARLQGAPRAGGRVAGTWRSR